MLSILVEREGVIIVGSSPTKQLSVNWEGGQESPWFAFADRGPTNLYSQRGFSDTSVSKHCNSPAIHIVLQVRGEEEKRGAVRTVGGEDLGSRTCQGRDESEVTRWEGGNEARGWDWEERGGESDEGDGEGVGCRSGGSWIWR